MSSDKELFSQYFKPTEVPELNLKNVSSILPFEVIGTDTSNGKRNVNIATGDFIKPPTNITNVQQLKEFMGEGNVGAAYSAIKPTLPEGKEILNIKGKDYLVDKNRPKGPNKILAGVMDFFDPEADRDKLGGMGQIQPDGSYAYNPVGGLTEVGDLDQYRELSPYQQKGIQDKFAAEYAKPKTALEKTEEYLEANELASDKLREISRKDRRAAGIDAQLQYALSEPVRQFFNERAARTRLGIEKEFAGFKESLPSAQQAIMSEKQKQQYLASAGFAAEAEAIAKQQEASKREDPRSYGQFASRA